MGKLEGNTPCLPTKKENHMIILIGIERAFDNIKVQHPFLIKSQQSKIEKNSLNLTPYHF